MAGEQKRKARALMVTKALLLGYEFRWGVFSEKACYLLQPNGQYYTTKWTGDPAWFVRKPVAFPAAWVAAQKALELAGVIDAKTVSGNTRARRSAR